MWTTQFRALHEARIAVDGGDRQEGGLDREAARGDQKYGQKTALLRDVLQQQSAVEAANADYNEAMASFWTAKANFQKAIGEE